MKSEAPNKWSKLAWLTANENPNRAAPTPPLPVASLDAGIPYRLHPLKAILLTIICALMGLGTCHIAATNDRGLIIEGIIHLNPHQASVFWYVLGFVSYGMALWGLFVAPQALIRRQIQLRDDMITLPGWGFSRKHYTVPATQILSFSCREYGRRKTTYIYIRIRTDKGTFRINSAWLPSHSDAIDILAWLHSHATSR